ncbi:MAG: hypothetical protein J6K64_06385 [Clostridia bacterium]|nr:hypothetical protein [Clostridia bacterium]MBP3446885.1 hypothetical protein [Clostridia bacterium]
MKRFIAITLSLIIILSAISFNASASYGEINDEITETIYFEDGSYIVITLEETTYSRATNTKSGSKTYTYTNSDNEKQWSVTLNGTFTYTGSTATCTNATISKVIYDDAWKFTSATTSKSGNKATGNITAKKYFLGIAIKTVNDSITLTCSATGTLS